MSNVPMHTTSPEASGDYRCLSCGNTHTFVGYDDHGYPGVEESFHEAACPSLADSDEECTCRVTLKQSFTVDEEGEVAYASFTGGGQDAVISSYTRIQCGVCERFVYIEPGSERCA